MSVTHAVDTASEISTLARRWQSGMHVDRAWRDHPQVSASQYAVLVAATSAASRDRVVTARLSKIAAALGRTGPRAKDQVARVLTHLEDLGALERSRTRRGAGVTRLRIARAAGGYDVIPWELLRAVQAGDVKAGVLRTWAHLSKLLGAYGYTGDTNTEIADTIGISVRTFSKHRAQLEQIGLICCTAGPRRLIVRAGALVPTSTSSTPAPSSAVTNQNSNQAAITRAVEEPTEVVHSHHADALGGVADAGSPHVADAGSIEDLAPVTSLTPEKAIFSSSRSARHLGERATRATSGRKRPTGGIYANPKVSEVRDLLETVRAWRFGPRLCWQAGILSQALPYLEDGMAPAAVAHALVVRAECDIDEAIELDQSPLVAAREGLRALAIDIRLGQACRHCGRDATEADQVELVDGRCDWCRQQEGDLDEIPDELLQQSYEPLVGSRAAMPTDVVAASDPDTNTAQEAQEDEPMHAHTDDCPIEHGDYRCYVDHSCRRPECREAWRLYHADRSRRIAYGQLTVDHYVTGSHARAHLEQLRDDGMTIKQISRESSVAPVTISRILDGHRTRESTQAKLLAVEPGTHEITDDTPDGALVNGAGTRRRLQALVVCGWTGTRLADRLGCTAANVNCALRKGEDEPTVTHFARTVRDLYEDLWDQEPPCANRHEEARAIQIRRTALERGWSPPMAWDEESIDDPDAEPAQWREVTDLGSGRRRMHLDDLEDCISWGLDINGAAARLTVTKDAVEACARRAQRPDVLERLRANGGAWSHVA